MADLSSLSDEQLQQLHAASSQPPKLSDLSNDQLVSLYHGGSERQMDPLEYDPLVSVARQFTNPESTTRLALKNARGSAANVAKGIYEAVSNPKETATAMGHLLGAVAAHTEDPEMRAALSMAHPDVGKAYYDALEARRAEVKPILDAATEGIKNRYGSLDALQHTFETDPVGLAMDASMFMPGLSPVSAAGKVAKVGAVDAGLKATQLYTGLRTGAGADAVRLAGQAGREGGEAQATLLRQLRGDGADMNEPVKLARSAFDKIDQTATENYLKGMAEVGKSTEPIDLGPVEKAIDKAKEVGSFKGRSGTAESVRYSEDVINTENKITELFNKWKDLDPAEYHTAQGLDALKKGVGEIRLKAQPGTKEWAVANKVYGAIKEQIVDQAPIYADTMLGYSTAQDTMEEIAKTFSLDKSNDTALRKLQSLMRDDVQGTYGGRRQLGQVLAEAEPMLPYALAGQALHTPLPRGILAKGFGLAELSAHVPTAVATFGTSLLPLAAVSPRAVGEISQGVGAATRYSEPAVNAATTAAGAASTPLYEAGNLERKEAERQRILNMKRKSVADIGAAKTVDDAIAAASSAINP